MLGGWKRRGWTISAIMALSLLAIGSMAHAGSTAKPARHRAAPPRSLECAAITFHGITTAGANGIQEAGFYRSGLGRLALQARIRGRHPVDYWLTLDGHALPPLTTLPPSSLEPCLRVKGSAVRLQQQSRPCLGYRFKIVLTRAGEKADQYILLYSLTSKAGGASARMWHFCKASVIPPSASDTN